MRILIALFFTLFTHLVFAENDTIFLSKKISKPKENIHQLLDKIYYSDKISEKEISLDILSDILWYANGINATGKSTSLSSFDFNCIDIYIAIKNKTYLYIPNKHCLIPIINQDIREYISNQPTIQNAPLTLIYISDYQKMKGLFVDSPEQKHFYSVLDVGIMIQNVNLYCMSANLNVMVSGIINRPLIINKLELDKFRYAVIVTQSIGNKE